MMIKHERATGHPLTNQLKILKESNEKRTRDILSRKRDSNKRAFLRHVKKAKEDRGTKIIRFAQDMESSGYDSDPDESSIRSTHDEATKEDNDLIDSMTKAGDLGTRLRNLTGSISQVAQRSGVQSAFDDVKPGKFQFEREKTFPGLNNRTKSNTALINWAMSVSSKSSGKGSDTSSSLLGVGVSQPINFLLRRYNNPDEYERKAKRKNREKLETSLSLPAADRIARLATLKQNVKFIEGKFRSLLNKKRRPSEVTREELRSQGTATQEEYWPSKFKVQGEALRFFRSRVRMIMITMRWISIIVDMNKNSSWERELKSFVDLAMDLGDQVFTNPSNRNSDGLSFDKNEFKANREISLSFDVKTILSTRPEGRTPEMIKQVMMGLQTLQSLSEYPLDTQEQLCRVAWFQQVPARKYIIRQGHIPEAFYFILSGLAVVKKIDTDNTTGEEQTRVVARLSRGQSFGELGLIFNTPRNATVESNSPMELLVIGKADFLKIFMHNVKPGEDPDHIAFLKQQPVLRFWPFDALKEDPGACLFNYFKRGTLVTENGKESEWIYFIKSGSCVALKRLKAVTPRSEKDLRRKHLRAAKEREALSIESRLNINPRKQKRQPLHPELFRSVTDYFDNVRSNAEDTRRMNLKNAKSSPGTRKTSTSRLSLPLSEGMEPSLTSHVYLKRTPPNEEISPCLLPPIAPSNPEGPGVSASKFHLFKNHFGKAHLTVPSLQNIRKTFAEKDISLAEALETNRDDKEDVFVTVEKLQARDIFGMNTLSFSDDDDSYTDAPDVALVSKGAEIVMLSKKLFIKHSEERTKLIVKELTTPYPLEAQLQENLQIKADWNTYRNAVLHDVMRINYSLKNTLTGVV